MTTSTTPIAEVFSAYTDEDHQFSRTRTVVRLFGFGVRFVSRSEAKRLMRGLDRFEEVTLDFTGVEEVGQGFVDEALRVAPAARRDGGDSRRHDRPGGVHGPSRAAWPAPPRARGHPEVVAPIARRVEA